ncbi:glycosyltransferase family 9 protein [Streptomyces triticirhizae]|uniref:Glycosyltransferase family 9 protein n=1 Tax=Streptomyces triticirhizae TaxID=2483353 RepID=A0A3M2KTT5_9ACTN|nr:glycosyltransferase family 9 protein [Streptomyces triticirhizae]RMI28879.1 glycosyltransferase family 9 protein [Streptomyces triticirhizae]
MSRPPRTLVVRLDGAGDVLLAGPAVRAVAAGSAATTLLCGPRGAAAGRLLPGVDEVLVYDAPWVSISPPAVRRSTVNELVERLAARRFERALVFASHGQSPLPAALLLKMSGVPWVAADCEHWPGSLLQLRHRRAERRHEVEAALDLAGAAGFPVPPGDDGALAVTGHEAAGELTGPGPYLVVHPGGRVADRSWTPARAERAVAALADAGHRVVVTGGPDERALTRRVAGRRALDLGGATGLPRLAGVLAGAGALVSGATGPAHLAAAVRTPVVCLLPPCLGADRLLPYRVPHLRLGDAAAESLDAIGEAELLGAVDALIGQGAAPGRALTS